MHITASIGIAFSSREYTKPEEIIRDADIAMCRAKAKGKARHAVFKAGMNANIIERLHLEAALHQAVEQKEFILHYQPIMDLYSKSVVGVEALIRWNHPGKGIVSPLEFIPLSEEIGLIHPISQWILEEACRQLKRWQEMYHLERHLRVSVNISGRQFSQPGLTDQVKWRLQDTGILPETLALEITESIIMKDISTSAKTISSLKDMGVISILMILEQVILP